MATGSAGCTSCATNSSPEGCGVVMGAGVGATAAACVGVDGLACLAPVSLLEVFFSGDFSVGAEDEPAFE